VIGFMHFDNFNRCASRGQCFHRPCLGTREFAARFALLPAGQPLPKAGDETCDIGLMLWDIDHQAKDRPSLFFRAKLENGVVRCPRPIRRRFCDEYFGFAGKSLRQAARCAALWPLGGKKRLPDFAE
jgi:hypothetical protein